MYALWRNGTWVGDIIHRGPINGEGDVPIGFIGVFVTTSALEFDGVRQARLPSRPGAPVVHVPLAPIDMNALWSTATGVPSSSEFSASSRVGARVIRFEDVHVPPERVFELRSVDGVPVPVYEITMQRRDFVEEGMAAGLLRALGLPITLRTGWEVTVTFEEPA